MRFGLAVGGERDGILAGIHQGATSSTAAAATTTAATACSTGGAELGVQLGAEIASRATSRSACSLGTSDIRRACRRCGSRSSTTTASTAAAATTAAAAGGTAGATCTTASACTGAGRGSTASDGSHGGIKPHVPGGPDDRAGLRLGNIHLYRADRLAGLVGHRNPHLSGRLGKEIEHQAILRIGREEHVGAFEPAIVGHLPLDAGAAVEKLQVSGEHLVVQLLQRRDIVHDPDGAAVRGEN